MVILVNKNDITSCLYVFNSLWPSDAIWWQIWVNIGLVNVTLWYQAITWTSVVWHSPQSYFKKSAHEFNLSLVFRYFHFNTMTTSPRASELINQFSKVYANERCSIYDVFPHWLRLVNTLRSRQHGRHFADDILKGIFLNENVIISIKKSLKFVPKGPINNIPALVQIMAWCWPGDKPLSEAMVVVQ